MNIWLTKYSEISLSSRNCGVDGDGHYEKINSDGNNRLKTPLYYKIINVNIVLYSGWQSLNSNVVWPHSRWVGGRRVISP